MILLYIRKVITRVCAVWDLILVSSFLVTVTMPMKAEPTMTVAVAGLIKGDRHAVERRTILQEFKKSAAFLSAMALIKSQTPKRTSLHFTHMILATTAQPEVMSMISPSMV